MTRRLRELGMLLAVVLLVSGCAASQAFKQGEDATQAGNLDEAVAAYRRAVQADPRNPNYAIALQRTMVAASRAHLERGAEFEKGDQLEAALGEYKLASEYDPSNRTVIAKVAALEQTIRDRIEASRPRPAIEALRAQARAAGAEPVLNPASRDPLKLQFPNAAVRDVLGFIANATGINITYDRDVADGRPISVQLDGVTLEQALNQIMTMAQLSYKVVNEQSIFVFPDTQPKHLLYDEQVVRTFYISNADPTELSQTLSQLIRIPGIAVQPMIAVNKTSNTITVRATTPGHPDSRAGSSSRTTSRAPRSSSTSRFSKSIASARKSYGLNLSDYAIGAVFSPVVAPGALTNPGGGTVGGAPATGAGANPGISTGPSTPPGARGPAAGVQPEYHHARRQHVGLLSCRPDGDRALPRDRHPHQGCRQAAAARRRRQQAVAEARTADSGRFDQLYADCDRRGGRESAELVYLRGHRREHRHDAACLARRRDHSRPAAGQQRARSGQSHRRRHRPDLRAAHAHDPAAPARRGIEPPGRVDSAARLQHRPGISRRDPRPVLPAGLFRQRRVERSDRDHHAADAAHRADAGAERVRPAADLHRIATEPRRRRAAAAHLRAAGRRNRRPRCRGAASRHATEPVASRRDREACRLPPRQAPRRCREPSW